MILNVVQNMFQCMTSLEEQLQIVRGESKKTVSNATDRLLNVFMVIKTVCLLAFRENHQS